MAQAPAKRPMPSSTQVLIMTPPPVERGRSGQRAGHHQPGTELRLGMNRRVQVESASTGAEFSSCAGNPVAGLTVGLKLRKPEKRRRPQPFGGYGRRKVFRRRADRPSFLGDGAKPGRAVAA